MSWHYRLPRLAVRLGTCRVRTHSLGAVVVAASSSTAAAVPSPPNPATIVPSSSVAAAVVLQQGPGYLVVDKPPGLHLRYCNLEGDGKEGSNEENLDKPNLEVSLRAEASLDAETEIVMCQESGQLEAMTSGTVFVATSRAVAAEVASLLYAQQITEIYTALVRGHLPLRDLIRCQGRLCKPSEGSTAWRLAGSRREGREACTLVYGLCHGLYGNEPCTLVELRPVTNLPQQLRLHCVALGHPIIGDELHSVDRRLDWRFEDPLEAARLMLHCWHLRMPLARGGGMVEATARDPLGAFLRSSDDDQHFSVCSEACTIKQSLLLDMPVSGLTKQLCHHPHAGLGATNHWETFAGGLGDGIIDDTHWDVPLTRLRTCKGPPYGPLEWDDRAARAEAFRKRK